MTEGRPVKSDRWGTDDRQKNGVQIGRRHEKKRV